MANNSVMQFCFRQNYMTEWAQKKAQIVCLHHAAGGEQVVGRNFLINYNVSSE